MVVKYMVIVTVLIFMFSVSSGFKEFLFWSFFLLFSNLLFNVAYKLNAWIYTKKLVARLCKISGYKGKIKVKILSLPFANAFACSKIPGVSIPFLKGADACIILTTGIVRKCNLDELNFVIAHEFSHIYRNHSRSTFCWNKFMGFSFTFFLYLFGIFGLIPITAVLGIERSRMRKYEIEADSLACEFLTKLGYSCKGGETLFKKLSKDEEEGGILAKVLSFFSTHPSFKKRIENLRKRVKR